LSLNFVNYDFQFDPSQNFSGEQFAVEDYTGGGIFAFETAIYLIGSSGTIVSSGTDFVSAAVTSTSVTVIDSGALAVLSGGTALYTTSPDRFARVAGGPRAPVHSCQCNALSRVSHAYKRFQSGHFIWRCNFV
jgi:hypothetical protein